MQQSIAQAINLASKLTFYQETNQRLTEALSTALEKQNILKSDYNDQKAIVEENREKSSSDSKSLSESRRVMTDLEMTLDETKSQLSLAISKVLNIKESISKNDASNNERRNRIQNLDVSIQSSQSLIKDLEERLDQIYCSFDESDKYLDELNDTRQNITHEVNGVLSDKWIAQFWMDATNNVKGKGGFRQFCQTKIVHLINSRLEQTLENLMDGNSTNLKCRLDEKLELVEDHRGALSFSQRSSGEKKKTSLAVVFTIMDLIIENSGFQTNLLFLDEIYDSIDEHGRIVVEKWISNYTLKKKNLKTFVITHTEINASGRSQGVIRVKKDRTRGSIYRAHSHSLGHVIFT